MKITFISDTHGKHNTISNDVLGTGDVLVHCGDLTNIGEEHDVIDFLDWFSKVEYTHKIFIAGNHDFWFVDNTDIPDVYKKNGVIYLCDNSVTIDGVKFYGSPWQPKFHNWAFNLVRNSTDLHDVWAKIPHDTDVLITHTPPYGHLDIVGQQRVGCELLTEYLVKVNPLINAFGHIHGSYGQKTFGETEFINASYLDDNYNLRNNPISLTIVNKKTRLITYD